VNKLKNMIQDVKIESIGTVVLQVGDGIARVYGLDQVMRW
jgi:F0F1-type ATP synthase alpha subunit